MSERISDEQLGQWAEKRADDAGRLARELVPLRARVAKLEAALEQWRKELCALCEDIVIAPFLEEKGEE